MEKWYQLVKPVGIAGAITGVLQSLVWILMGIVGILFHYEIVGVPVVEPSKPTYSENLTLHIYNIYLTPLDSTISAAVRDAILIKSDVLVPVIWTYLGLSFIWFILASALLWSLFHENIKIMRMCFDIWVGLVTIISLLDLALTILLGIDYSYLDANSGTFPTLACGIMMSLAARGYVLWIVNVTFIFVFAGNAVNMRRANFTHTKNRNLTTYPGSSAWISPHPANGKDNPIMAFENPGYERSSSDWHLPANDSFHDDRYSVRSAPISPRPYGYATSDYSGKNSAPTSPIPASATIPRPKSIGPYIPPPDYSPPSTPRLKSALKSHQSPYF